MTITVKMKKFTFLLVLAIVSVGIGTVSAQSLQEVVYLKNGSVIRGTIIEQVPNESLKIQTSDGSVFAWKQYALSTPGRYVRLTALDGSVTLNEAGLKYTDTPVVVSGIRRSGLYDRNGRFRTGSRRVFDFARLSDSTLLFCRRRCRCALLFRCGCSRDSDFRRSAGRSAETLRMSVYRYEDRIYGA